jgi:hypothetical protein
VDLTLMQHTHTTHLYGHSDKITDLGAISQHTNIAPRTGDGRRGSPAAHDIYTGEPGTTAPGDNRHQTASLESSKAASLESLSAASLLASLGQGTAVAGQRLVVLWVTFYNVCDLFCFSPLTPL